VHTHSFVTSQKVASLRRYLAPRNPNGGPMSDNRSQHEPAHEQFESIKQISPYGAE